MTSLLDVSVLVALSWSEHAHHATAQRWFAESDGTWCTCSITQAGFVRVSANPVVLSQPVSVAEAIDVLRTSMTQPGHTFLLDAAGFVDNPLVPHELIVGHRQVTDAHLVAIARHHGVTLATLDRSMSTLAPDVVRVITPR